LQISITKWEWDFSDDFGYARISTANQDYAEPVETPQVEGVNKVCSGKIGGGRAGRPQFAKLMAALKAGDVVCVTKLDRPELAKLYCMAFAAGGRRLSSSGPNADVILSSPCSSQVCTSLKSAPHRSLHLIGMAGPVSPVLANQLCSARYPLVGQPDWLGGRIFATGSPNSQTRRSSTIWPAEQRPEANVNAIG
jgi:Resolvase, N terminal domain